jgi:predicted  nucleic acid-binding Zn-ribbon protein
VVIKQILDNVDGQLHKWNGELDEITARIDKAGADLKLKYASRLQDFNELEKQIRDMMAKARSADEESWPNIKARLEYARDGYLRKLTQLVNKLEKDAI